MAGKDQKGKLDVDVYDEFGLPPFQVADTPRERLKQVFQKSAGDIRSFELQTALISAMVSFMFGFAFGSMKMAKAADRTWKQTHYHSLFYNEADYTRYYLNYMGKRVVFDGAKVGLRTGFLGGIMTLTIGCLFAARDKARITDIGIGGTLASLLYRIDVGPRAMLSTGLIGGVYWQLLGMATLPLIRISGYTFDEFYKTSRKEYYENMTAKKRMQKEMKELARTENLWPWEVRRRWAETKLEDEERLVTLRTNTVETAANMEQKKAQAGK